VCGDEICETGARRAGAVGGRPAARAHALVLDDRGEMRLGMRAYTAVRIGTETMGGDSDPLTFPGSGAGHIRQHRYFLELKLDHDIRRLAKTGWGVARAFDWLDPDTLRYSLQYRGEGEGIYDYGPDEFHHQYTKTLAVENDVPNIPALGLSSKVPPEFARQRVDRLRRIARQRHRFFLGYIDFEKGPVFIRIGRQILAGARPTSSAARQHQSARRLVRRVLHRARRAAAAARHGARQLSLPSIGPIHDSFLEGFVALGNKVSTFPGIPPGSPWEPGALGHPVPT
jgi:hypothetical protein